MRKVQFYSHHYYHIYNRGVDKRRVFLDGRDYLRFYVSMFLFNNALYRAERGLDVDEVLKTGRDMPREPMVSILSYCLIPNHFHMFVRPLTDEGMSGFMHRLLMGYARYFNLKQERTGRLFETEYKAVFMEHEGQFEHMPRYIHLNALDTIDPGWRNGTVKDWERSLQFLDSYPWSSHHVYMGKTEPLPVVDTEFAVGMFGSPSNYVNYLKDWSVSNAHIYKP